MSEPLIVWVVTEGVYSSRLVTQVYASAQAAMASMPIQVYAWQGSTRVRVPVQWRQDQWGAWANNGDNDEACDIWPFEVKGP